MTEKKILVVDDEKTNVTIMHELLDDEYTVKSVESGTKAVEIFNEFYPDVVLLDISMPYMDGYEVCEWVRNKSNHTHVPVIFVSAKDSLEEKLKGYQIGGDDYLTKPFEGVELLAKIKVFFEKSVIIDELELGYSNACSAAMEAMTGAENAGVIIRFIDNCIDCEHFSDIAKELFKVTDEFGLHCALQIRSRNDELNFNSMGESKPLEEELMRRVHTKGRFYDTGSRTFVNFDNATMLVKNMPINDMTAYGRIKDNLPHLLKSADARIRAIENEKSGRQKRMAIKRAVEDTRGSLQKAQLLFNQIKDNNNNIMEGLILEMDAELLSLNLGGVKERYLMELLQRNRKEMEESYGSGEQLEQIFRVIVEEMFEMANE